MLCNWVSPWGLSFSMFERLKLLPGLTFLAHHRVQNLVEGQLQRRVLTGFWEWIEDVSKGPSGSVTDIWTDARWAGDDLKGQIFRSPLDPQSPNLGSGDAMRPSKQSWRMQYIGYGEYYRAQCIPWYYRVWASQASWQVGWASPPPATASCNRRKTEALKMKWLIHSHPRWKSRNSLCTPLPPG